MHSKGKSMYIVYSYKNNSVVFLKIGGNDLWREEIPIQEIMWDIIKVTMHVVSCYIVGRVIVGQLIKLLSGSDDHKQK